MIANTLKKWRHNWKFLLVVTIMQIVAIIDATVFAAVREYYTVPHPAPSIWPRVLGWPLLTNFFDLGSQRSPSMIELASMLLVLVWNAFLWAWALLELKQVLARTFTRRSRI